MGGRKRSDGKAAAAATDVLLPGPGAPTACTPPPRPPLPCARERKEQGSSGPYAVV